MKLTAEQITYIENYIKSFDIKYYEVYMEILDHIILSVEEILEENKEISFEKQSNNNLPSTNRHNCKPLSPIGKKKLLPEVILVIVEILVRTM